MDGELFIKPCTETEIEFYQSAIAQYPQFTELLPLFMGTLTLSDSTEVTTAADDIAVINTVVPEAIEKSTAAAAPDSGDGVTWKPNRDKRIKTDQAIVLENLTHGYKKPNILDAKLGVRLWADDAPLQKRQRFDTISAETTHSQFGCRIAGMRIYKGSEDPAELDQQGYKIYDRDYGRVAVNNGNFIDEIRRFVFNKRAGIDEDLGKAVCKGFAHELRTVEEVLAAHETRMYSSSILFIFEGDGKALEEAIERNNAIVDELNEDEAEGIDNEFEATGVKGLSTARYDSGVGMDASGDEDDPSEREGSRPGDGSAEKGGSNGEDDSGGKDRPDGENGSVEKDESGDEDSGVFSLPKIFTLKLIDCAHAKWVPGDGPDENTLTGVRSLRRIFEDLSA